MHKSFFLFSFTILAALGGGAMIVSVSAMVPIGECLGCG
jgi:hypothetical protein